MGQQGLPAAGADVCADVMHRPADDVTHTPDAGVETGPGLAFDLREIEVPVVVDVLRRGKPGQAATRPPLRGETWLGMAMTDGRSVLLEGPAINGGKPLVLGPDCRLLAPEEAEAQRSR